MSFDADHPAKQPIRDDLRELGCSIFGSDEAQRWLARLDPLLGAAPLAASQSASGAERVRELLASIKHGGVA